MQLMNCGMWRFLFWLSVKIKFFLCLGDGVSGMQRTVLGLLFFATPFSTGLPCTSIDMIVRASMMHCFAACGFSRCAQTMPLVRTTGGAAPVIFSAFTVVLAGGGGGVEEQGTWAAQKHSEAGYGRPADRGVWTAKTVKRPRQQPAHPQYANYWASLTRKGHTPPHSAQSQHTNYWAPRTRKRHQREHRLQRPTERSDPT